MTRFQLAISVLLVTSAAVSDARGQGEVLCDNPRTKPAYQRGWIPSHYADHVVFDSTHLFIASPVSGNIYRYTLDGTASATWSSQSTGLATPHVMDIHPLNGDLYVAEFQNSHSISVFDVDGNGTPKDVLFTGDPDPSPGGIVGELELFRFHPVTGRLFVFSQGWYSDGGYDPVWISRIQRFDENGNYDNFVINNALGLTPSDPGYNQYPPVFPDCGAWHYPGYMWVDKYGNLFFHEYVNGAAEMRVVHKFDDTGECVERWDVTGKIPHVDPDGFIFEAAATDSSIAKLSPDRSETLYTIKSSAPIKAMQSMVASSEFLLASADMGSSLRRLQFYGPRLEALNIIGATWQDATTFQLMADSLELLTSCNTTMVQMDGAVADGVSPLLLRWKVPGPGEVEWLLSDPLSSSFALLGTLASLDSADVDTLSIEVPVVAIGGPNPADREFFAFGVYTAPIDFDRPGTSDNNSRERFVQVEGRYRPEGTPSSFLVAAEILRIERPPILALHGLWSNNEAWDEFGEVSDDQRWTDRWVAFDYKRIHGQGLETTAPRVLDAVGDAIERVTGGSETPRRVVAAQVDVVAHSMGGVMLRKFADRPDYRRVENMGMGDYHKVLFIDTPHTGSPLANLMVEVKDLYHNPPVGRGRNARRVYARALMLIPRVLGAGAGQEEGKATDDLTTYSSELMSLQEIKAPIHAHVGDASSFFDLPEFQQWALALDGIAGALLLGFKNLSNGLVLPSLLTNASDLVVFTDSQAGGLSSSNYLLTNHALWSQHWNVLRYNAVVNLAEEWALRRTTDSFFAQSIPAPVFPQGLQYGPRTAASQEETLDKLLDFYGTALEITQPIDGATVFPGQNVDVSVQNNTRYALGYGAVFYTGGAIFADDLDGTLPAGASIPLDFAGPFELMAMGILSNGQGVRSPIIRLNVDPGAAPTSPTIEELRVDPPSITLVGAGDTRQLSVYALYSDGIERNITNVAPPPQYWGSVGFIANVSSDGTIVATSPGTGSLVATKGAVSAPQVPVEVVSGPSRNNPPHAISGGPYAGCDSQLVTLDGSASYDRDVLLGDVLTYEWDLDADGEFDDATGVTPAVQLRLPGTVSLIGLRVTDAQGASAVDYTLLEAGPGCLDGDFVCAIERPYGLNAMGQDASGNVYVVETFDGSLQRVVKFSSACDSLLAFDLSGLPLSIGAMAVAPNDTLYLSDGDRAYVYTGDGTQVATIVLEAEYVLDIAVDAAGHIYGAGFSGNEAVVQKFDADGSLITTWNVSQDVGICCFSGPIAVDAEEAIYMRAPESSTPGTGDRIVRAMKVGGAYGLDLAWGGGGVDPGRIAGATDISVGSEGDVYVLDGPNYRIQRFKSDSTYVRMWTGSGNPAGSEFSSPSVIGAGVAGSMVVTDHPVYGAYRLQVMNATKPPIAAEITARTRLDSVGIYHEQPDTAATGCPQGDYDDIVISVAIDEAAVSGPIPKSAFSLGTPTGGAVFYASARADSDATLIEGKYRTTITVRRFGGCMTDSVTVKLNGLGIGKAALKIHSFDLDTSPSSYGVLNVADFGLFGLMYPPNPYNECADYRPAADTAVNVIDFGKFGEHYVHGPGGGSAQAATQPLMSGGTIRLDLSEHTRTEGRRSLRAKIVLENVEPFAAMILAFKNENSKLKYQEWTPSPVYNRTTMCAEVVRDGVKQVFVGVVGSGASPGAALEVGEIVFDIRSSDLLTLTAEDLEMLVADLLEPEGKIRTFSQVQFERTEPTKPLRNELAQNYPNPFNPSTTIAFSLARAGHTQLAIYDVRGGLVRVLVNDTRPAGRYDVQWDGRDGRGMQVASGIYFYRLQAGDFTATRKMLMLK